MPKRKPMTPGELDDYIRRHLNTTKSVARCMEETGTDTETFMTRYNRIAAERGKAVPTISGKVGFRAGESGKAAARMKYLPPAAVDEIRELRRKGVSYSDIGKKFDVSSTYIRSVIDDPEKYRKLYAERTREHELSRISEGHRFDVRRDVPPNAAYSVSMEDYKVLIRLRDAGATVIQVQRFTGINAATIVKILTAPERRVRGYKAE